MNEHKLARAAVAQLDMNFALIGLIFKLIEASPSTFATDGVKDALTELLAKNSEILKATKDLVPLSLRED